MKGYFPRGTNADAFQTADAGILVDGTLLDAIQIAGMFTTATMLTGPLTL